MGKNKRQTKNGINRHVLITALTGVVYWLIGEGIYTQTTAKWFTPFAIAFWFVLFAVVIGVVLAILSCFNADFSNPQVKKNREESFRLGIALLIILSVFAAFLEFLYELGKQSIPEPTSYIFLIDDSGSMEGTEQERTEAISDIMNGGKVSLPYAVYSFTSEATLIKPIGSYHTGDEAQIRFLSDGGTDILGSLAFVLSDLKEGKLSQAGANPRVLLLSDGASSSWGLKNVCRQSVNQGVSVSTVGMRGSNASLLKRIAGLTGGVFVRCDDVSALSSTMNTAITSNAERNLLSERVMFKRNLLYGILRVVFLVLLCFVWSLYKGRFVWEDNSNTSKGGFYPPWSPHCCAFAAVTLELLANSGISLRMLRLVFCVLWAVTIGHSNRRSKEAYYTTKVSFGGGSSLPPQKSDSQIKSIIDDQQANHEIKTIRNDGDNTLNPLDVKPESGPSQTDSGVNTSGSGLNLSEDPFNSKNN